MLMASDDKYSNSFLAKTKFLFRLSLLLFVLSLCTRYQLNSYLYTLSNAFERLYFPYSTMEYLNCEMEINKIEK